MRWALIKDVLWRERGSFALPIGVVSLFALGAHLLTNPVEAWSLWTATALGGTFGLALFVMCRSTDHSKTMSDGGGGYGYGGDGGYGGGCDGGDC